MKHLFISDGLSIKSLQDITVAFDVAHRPTSARLCRVIRPGTNAPDPELFATNESMRCSPEPKGERFGLSLTHVFFRNWIWQVASAKPEVGEVAKFQTGQCITGFGQGRQPFQRLRAGDRRSFPDQSERKETVRVKNYDLSTFHLEH